MYGGCVDGCGNAPLVTISKSPELVVWVHPGWLFGDETATDPGNKLQCRICLVNEAHAFVSYIFIPHQRRHGSVFAMGSSLCQGLGDLEDEKGNVTEADLLNGRTLRFFF